MLHLCYIKETSRKHNAIHKTKIKRPSFIDEAKQNSKCLEKSSLKTIDIHSKLEYNISIN